MLAKYVTDHKIELDELMRNIFSHWNKIGALDVNQETSNKMQITFLTSIIRIWLTTSGMPKPTQKQVLQQLLKNL